MDIDLNSEIESLVLGDDKIVTYKLINQKFNVTPLEAKNALQEFVSKTRADKVQKLVFFVTYSVIAEDKKTKKKHILLINEQDLEGVSNDYKLISKKIYSIQKNFVEDFDLIYGNDLSVSNDVNRKTNIKILNAGLRDNTPPSNSAISSLSSSSSDSISTIASIKNEKTSVSKTIELIKKPNESEKVTKQETSANESKHTEKTESTAKKATTSGIAAMFNKQKEQQLKNPIKEEPNKTSSEIKKSPIESKTKSPVETKQAKIKSPPVKKKKSDVKRKEVSKKVNKNLKDEIIDDIEMIDVEAEEKKKEAPSDLFDDEHDAEIQPSTSTTGDNGSMEEDEYEDEQINKKRRRKGKASKAKNAQVINSDDESTVAEDENKTTSKKAKIKKPENNKEIDQMLNKENRANDSSTSSNQKKKLVTKTFVDKDGYNVTQKVWEIVEDDSATSEKEVKKIELNEDSVLKEEKQKKQSENKTSKVTMNQPTLTNFFKRN